MAYGDREELIDSRVMIQADLGHLAEAIRNGDRVRAHGFLDSIIDLKRGIEDLEMTIEDMPELTGRAAIEK